MVCIDCNGKGYVIEKERDLVCKGCQGHGEYPFFDSDRHQKQEAQEVHEARKLSSISHSHINLRANYSPKIPCSPAACQDSPEDNFREMADVTGLVEPEIEAVLRELRESQKQE